MTTQIVHQSEGGSAYAFAMAKAGGKSLDPDMQAAAVRMLREFIESVGGQATAAKQLGISQGYLSEVLNGNRGGGQKLLKGLARFRPDIVALFMGTTPPEATTTHYDSEEAWRARARAEGFDPDDPEVTEVYRTAFKDAETTIGFAAAELRRRQAERKGKTLGVREVDEDEEGLPGRRGKKP